jgi:hypothetical protein
MTGVGGFLRHAREVLRLLARGFSLAEIARKLVISPKTVGTHIERVLAKLGRPEPCQSVTLTHGKCWPKSRVTATSLPLSSAFRTTTHLL